MVEWMETYRGTVFPWEVDLVEHFTVAYYFDRLADAGWNALEALGLGADYVVRTGCACVTEQVYVRYRKELRAGDIMHIQSGVIRADDSRLVLGHTLRNTTTEEVCTTFEHHLAHVRWPQRTRLPWTPEQQAVVQAHCLPWDGPPREVRPLPATDAGFVASGKDTVKPWELDVLGVLALKAYIHRCSGAGAHLFAQFGMHPAYFRQERRGFSTFEFQFELRGDLRAGDPVQVRTGLLHLGSSSLRFQHRLYHGRSGQMIASLDQYGVHLDTDARRPAPLPAALRQQAQGLVIPVQAE
jgi:acyl-CoA thioesterase FadM